MKRFVSLILSVCFLFSINTVSYAANISSRKASNPVIQSITVEVVNNHTFWYRPMNHLPYYTTYNINLPS